MDLQELVNTMLDTAQRERSNYHATFGDLIDALKKADDNARISPVIVGVSAYRGYYSNIALCTKSVGIYASKKELDYNMPTEQWGKFHEENDIKIEELPKNPTELAEILESLIGSYFDGYKGGYNQITRDKPLWVAADYGDCSRIAVVRISDKLKLIRNKID